jgi:hypothetical protein
MGGEYHYHVASFNTRFPFNYAAFRDKFGHLLQDGIAVLSETHFPSSENNIYFNLVAAVQKFEHMADLYFEVMCAGKRSQLDFFGLDPVNRDLFLLFFTLLIFELPVVHQPAYRRIGIVGDLYKIESLFSGDFLGLLISYYAELIAFAVNDP